MGLPPLRLKRLERLENLLFFLNLVTWVKGMYISG
jgi:hypothetical protein